MIIETLARLSGMSSNKKINRMAFCLLAGIPHLWLRLQTIRITDLLVNIHTNYCLSGRSTRARLCNLVGRSAQDIEAAIAEINSKRTLNLRSNNRISSSVRFLNDQNIALMMRSQGTKRPEQLVDLIRVSLEPIQTKKIIAYTDGSTDVHRKHANSGCGIVITNTEHKTIWQGGMPVRSDGNNFIAELAAVSCIVKALPSNFSMTLRSDSLATIGAISRGPVSERRRIRAAGRPWISFCRSAWIQKCRNIRTEHVYSHRGTDTPEQRGNDAADRLANQYRKASVNKPEPYFMLSEEQFILKYDGKVIQGDPRRFLKAHENHIIC